MLAPIVHFAVAFHVPTMDLPAWLWEIAFAAYAVTVTIIVVSERRRPTTTLALVLALVFVPVIGLLVYLFFAQRMVRRRRLRARRVIQPLAATRTIAAISDLPAELPPIQRGLVQLALATAAAPLRRAAAVRLHSDGAETFAAMLERIAAASGYVHAEFYIWRDDETGRQMVAALAACARAGVRVRVLIDHVGSFGLSDEHFAALRDAGGEVALFGRLRFPARPWRPRANYRNHRKILVIDGEVGFIGGVNIGNEYAGRGGEHPCWRDLMVEVTGDAVVGLGTVFLEDWLATTGQAIDLQGVLPPTLERIDARRPARRPGSRRRPGALERDLRAGDPFAVLPERPPSSTGPLAQVIPSGPDAPVAESIAAQIVAAIAGATQRAWLVTPYFIPDEALMLTLRTAALRGVDVRIVVPSAAHSDSRLTALAAASYYDELLDAGCRIFEYEAGMLHAKYFVIDELAAVGSANVDSRSFYINYEVIAMFYSADVTAALAEVFVGDLADARELTEGSRPEQGRAARLLEGVARVLSPLL